MIPGINSFLQKLSFHSSEKTALKAYDIWSDTYDQQPGNLMLELDEEIFSKLIQPIDLKDKTVADIGCGTGRHWPKIYGQKPQLVTGFDISRGMLNQLRRKFPSAETRLIRDNRLTGLPDSSLDCLITTLTIAHIEDINEAIANWARVLKKGGDLIITDFHPMSLVNGGKRSFRHAGKSYSVVNYVHPLEEVIRIFNQQDLVVIRKEERVVNEEVRPYYESQNALQVYYRFRGIPIIYGLHLKKQSATQ